MQWTTHRCTDLGSSVNTSKHTSVNYGCSVSRWASPPMSMGRVLAFGCGPHQPIDTGPPGLAGRAEGLAGGLATSPFYLFEFQMVRPQLFYIIYANGLAAKVIEGRKSALRGELPVGSYATRQRAEEVAAWHNYEAHRPGGWLHHLTMKEADRPKPVPPPCTCCHCRAVRGFSTKAQTAF